MWLFELQVCSRATDSLGFAPLEYTFRKEELSL